MKRLIFGAAALVAVMMASCGGNKNENKAEDNSAFAENQPVACGEYRAVSFQKVEAESKRMPFDGRIIFALDPDNSGIYVYENGNRTHFKASVSLTAPFEKQDSVYVATDAKQQKVEVISGAELDTLVIVKDNAPVKIAFERKAVSTMRATDAWQRISTLLSK